MLDFDGYGDRQRRIWPFVIARGRLAYSVPSALHQEQITLFKCEDVERLERSDKKR
jgi:hypothetical protein